MGIRVSDQISKAKFFYNWTGSITIKNGQDEPISPRVIKSILIELIANRSYWSTLTNSKTIDIKY